MCDSRFLKSIFYLLSGTNIVIMTVIYFNENIYPYIIISHIDVCLRFWMDNALAKQTLVVELVVL
jgi:hypothetical protein